MCKFLQTTQYLMFLDIKSSITLDNIGHQDLHDEWIINKES